VATSGIGRSSGSSRTKDLSGSNLSDKYIAQGLTAVNGMKRTWDFNPNGGGPIVRDKLWFYGAYRNNQIERYVADAFYSKDPLAWTFNPDTTRQGRRYAGPPQLRGAPHVAGVGAQQINFSYEKDRRITPLRRVAATVSPEATTYTPF